MKRFRVKNREALTGMLYAAVPLAGFAVFFAAPFVISVVRTFYSGAGSLRFVGLAHYISVFQSEAFRLALGNTLRFIGLGVPLILALSFTLSVALRSVPRGKNVFHSLFIMPLVVPVASVILVFSIVFERSGILNHALASLGLLSVDFMNGDKAFIVLMILYIWKNCGYNIILFLAGLSQIPSEYYDAAKTDGASAWRTTVLVTLPLLAPTIFFTTVVSVINCFKSFREAFALFGAYPHQSIYMLQHFMNNNFYSLNYARLSVASLLTFTIIITLVAVLYGFREKAGDHPL